PRGADRGRPNQGHPLPRPADGCAGDALRRAAERDRRRGGPVQPGGGDGAHAPRARAAHAAGGEGGAEPRGAPLGAARRRGRIRGAQLHERGLSRGRGILSRQAQAPLDRQVGVSMAFPSGRHFLQIPGPTNVPDRVLRAIDRPTIDHRGPEFAKLAKEVLAGLQRVFRTKQPVIVYPASGTGAWEAALSNTRSPGDRVLMFETGHFATLWEEMARRLGLQVELVPGDWRHGVDPKAVEDKLRAAPQEAGLRRSYWDWAAMLRANESGFFPYTPATNLLYGLRESIAMLEEEGLENVFRRHSRHGEATRRAVRAWGLEVNCADEREHS